MEHFDIYPITQAINDSFGNLACDLHRLEDALRVIGDLGAQGVQTGDATTALQAQIAGHTAALNDYKTRLEVLRDECHAKSLEVAEAYEIYDPAMNADGTPVDEPPATTAPPAADDSTAATAANEPPTGTEGEQGALADEPVA